MKKLSLILFTFTLFPIAYAMEKPAFWSASRFSAASSLLRSGAFLGAGALFGYTMALNTQVNKPSYVPVASENPQLALKADKFIRKQCRSQKKEAKKANREKDKVTHYFVNNTLPEADENELFQKMNSLRVKRDEAQLAYLKCREKAALSFKAKA